jgi:GNAT superfamily N-acetyltransferase
MKITVRQAQVGEWEKLVNLYIKEGYLDDASLVKRDGPFEFSQIGKERTIWFAEVENEIVGAVQLVFSHPESDLANGLDKALLHHLRVAYSQHGKGVGSLLFKELIKKAHEKNIQSITLEVDPRNKSAYQVYKHWGFTKLRDGKEKPQVIMIKQL